VNCTADTQKRPLVYYLFHSVTSCSQ
jgi:hypothetical protein